MAQATELFVTQRSTVGGGHGCYTSGTGPAKAIRFESLGYTSLAVQAEPLLIGRQAFSGLNTGKFTHFLHGIAITNANAIKPVN